MSKPFEGGGAFVQAPLRSIKPAAVPNQQYRLFPHTPRPAKRILQSRELPLISIREIAALPPTTESVRTGGSAGAILRRSCCRCVAGACALEEWSVFELVQGSNGPLRSCSVSRKIADVWKLQAYRPGNIVLAGFGAMLSIAPPPIEAPPIPASIPGIPAGADVGEALIPSSPGIVPPPPPSPSMPPSEAPPPRPESI